jgi:cysteine desulfurase
MSMQRVYLDYAATTPLHPHAMEAMLPYFSQEFGNPSSVHVYGQQAEAAVEASRETVARVLGCAPREVIFTSCGSESDNLALRGAALAGRARRGAKHLLVSPVEHHAVSRTAEHLQKYLGFEVEWLPVDKYGCVHPEDVEKRIRPETALVSVMYANNEIGSVNPITEIGGICRQQGIPFHTDAVQAAAYLPVNVDELNVDLLSLGAHKFYGPKGVGALYIRSGTELVPSQTGGSQEAGMRAGTHNVPYIVGLAAALKLTQAEQITRCEHVRPLRDQIIGRVLEEVPEALLTGHPTQRLSNHASFVFRGVDGNALLVMLDSQGFACSSGSACKTGSPEPSEVLTTLGLDRDWALGSLRVTLGVETTAQEVSLFLEALPAVVERNRQLVR